MAQLRKPPTTPANELEWDVQWFERRVQQCGVGFNYANDTPVSAGTGRRARRLYGRVDFVVAKYPVTHPISIMLRARWRLKQMNRIEHERPCRLIFVDVLRRLFHLQMPDFRCNFRNSVRGAALTLTSHENVRRWMHQQLEEKKWGKNANLPLPVLRRQMHIAGLYSLDTAVRFSLPDEVSDEDLRQHSSCDRQFICKDYMEWWDRVESLRGRQLLAFRLMLHAIREVAPGLPIARTIAQANRAASIVVSDDWQENEKKLKLFVDEPMLLV